MSLAEKMRKIKEAAKEELRLEEEKQDTLKKAKKEEDNKKTKKSIESKPKEAISEVKQSEKRKWDSMEVFRAMLNLMDFQKDEKMIKMNKPQTKKKVKEEMIKPSQLAKLFRNFAEMLEDVEDQ